MKQRFVWASMTVLLLAAALAPAPMIAPDPCAFIQRSRSTPVVEAPMMPPTSSAVRLSHGPDLRLQEKLKSET
jgi:hypothetical protein